MNQKRNGEIDLLRFIFSIIIVVHHFSSSFNFNISRQGYIGVEFFFLISGYLMAKSAHKLLSQKNKLGAAEIANESWSFILKKIKVFYCYYICSIFVQIIVKNILICRESPVSLVINFLKSIPTFTLTFMGLNNNSVIGFYVGSTWYLSAMIIAMFILFPLLLKNFNYSCKLLFPAFSVFLLGYLYTTDNSIANWQGWSGICFNGVLRALGEISLGCFLYILSDSIKNKYEVVFSKNILVRLGLTVFKYMCFAVIIGFALDFWLDSTFDLHALLFCAIGIVLSFSKTTFTIPESKLSNYLGKISLPIYIFHGVIRYSAEEILITKSVTPLFFVSVVIFAIIVSILLMYLTDFIQKILKKISNKILSPTP